MSDEVKRFRHPVYTWLTCYEDGRVWSDYGHDGRHDQGQWIKGGVGRYLSYSCSFEGYRGQQLHRIIWEAFNGIIPEGYHIHHVNGNRHDNRLSNLQLISSYDHLKMHKNSKEHLEFMHELGLKYGEKNLERAREVSKKPVMQYTIHGEFVKEWKCASDASKELGISHPCISSCLNGRQKKAGNFIWKYKNEDEYDKPKKEKKFYNEKIVYMLDPHSGDILNVFKSTQEASRTTGLSRSGISRCCNGKLKEYKGYIFKYK